MPPVSTPPPAVQRTPLEIYQGCIQTNRETLNTARLAEGQLTDQGKQIDAIAPQLHEIDRQVDRADTKVGQMKSWTGHGFWYRFKKALSCCSSASSVDVVKGNKELFKETAQVVRQDVEAQQTKRFEPVQSHEPVEQDLEERALDTIEEQVHELKENAERMGHLLDHQNVVLDVTHEAMQVTNYNLAKVTRRVRGVD